MTNNGISLSSDEIETLVVWVDVRLHLFVGPVPFMISVVLSLLYEAKSGMFSSVGYSTDNTSMMGAPCSKHSLFVSLPVRETWLFVFILMFLS